MILKSSLIDWFTTRFNDNSGVVYFLLGHPVEPLTTGVAAVEFFDMFFLSPPVHADLTIAAGGRSVISASLRLVPTRTIIISSVAVQFAYSSVTISCQGC